jgi:16S rRNA (guanine527-N7)-methyltransferase
MLNWESREMKKQDFRSETAHYLKKGLKELKLELSPDTQANLLLYLEELSTFAVPLGLTSLKSPQDLVTKHLLDSLLILPYLPEGGPVLDLGTGAGLPGMVIKIVRPWQEVWLVDARKRPISFLHYVAGKLKLQGLQIVQATVGKGDPLPRDYFAAVVSRAVTSLKRLWGLASPLLRADGFLLAMKGPRMREEIAALEAAFSKLAVTRYDLRLPLMGDRRAIVKIRVSPS